MGNLKKLVNANCLKLSNSGKTFEDIYNIIFSQSKNVMAEYNRGKGLEQCTYGEAQSLIDTVSRAVSDEIGASGRFVGLCAENCVEWIILFWAILKSGNKPYLINLRQPMGFTKGILDTLSVELVVYREAVSDLGRKALSYAELIKRGEALPLQDDISFGNEFAISTNGTTLKKKICIYSGSELSAQILNILTIQKKNMGLIETYKGKIKVLAFLPLYHIFGFEAMYIWYAFWGSTFVFLPDMLPENILHTVRRHEVTHIFAVPLLWNAVEKSLCRTISSQDEKTQRRFEFASKLSLNIQNVFPSLGRALAAVLLRDVRCRLFGSSVRFCISGGSAVKESTLKLINSLGYGLYNGYGMSEIGITSVELTRRVKERIQGSIGMPFASVEYRIGEDSKLFVRGSSLCRRMIIDGEVQENGEWFDTGDIMSCDKRGCYYISGRISDVVFGAEGENLNPDFAQEAFSLPDAVNFSVLGNEDNSHLMLIVQIPRDLLSVQRNRLLRAIEECNATLSPTYQVREFKYTYDPIMDDMAIKVSRTYLKKAVA